MSRSDEVSPVFKTSDTTYQSPVVDSMTHALISIDYEHHEIHSGDHFNYCDYQLGNASAAEIEFTVTTPNSTKWWHLTYNVFS